MLQVLELLILKLANEPSFHRKVDLLFLVDSITQCSHSQKGMGLLKVTLLCKILFFFHRQKGTCIHAIPLYHTILLWVTVDVKGFLCTDHYHNNHMLFVKYIHPSLLLLWLLLHVLLFQKSNSAVSSSISLLTHVNPFLNPL